MFPGWLYQLIFICREHHVDVQETVHIVTSDIGNVAIVITLKRREIEKLCLKVYKSTWALKNSLSL